MSAWPAYHRDGGDLDGNNIRRQASNMRGLVMIQWRDGYRADFAELRKSDGRVIRLDQKEGKIDE